MNKKILIIIILLFVVIFFIFEDKIIKKDEFECVRKVDGLLSQQINDIDVDKEGNLYIASNAGIYKSIDNGNSWHRLKIDSVKNLNYIKKIVINKKDNIIYTLIGEHASKQVYKSYDNGITWAKLVTLDENIIDIDLSQNGSFSSDLYALTYTSKLEGNTSIYNYYINKYNFEKNIEKFSETGKLFNEYWSKNRIDIDYTLDSLTSPTSIKFDGKALYLLIENPNFLYLSLDEGKNWTKINEEGLDGYVTFYSTLQDNMTRNSNFQIIVKKDGKDYNNYLYELFYLNNLKRIEKNNFKKLYVNLDGDNKEVIKIYPYLNKEEFFINNEKYKQHKNDYFYVAPHSNIVYLKDTIFIAANNGVYACEVK